MNIIQIAGHLGADVETRVTPDGQKVSTIRVATNSKKAGREETIWWRVTLWGDRWDKILPYLTKGASIIIVGEMQKPEIYKNREGQPQISLDIRAEMVRFSPFGKSERSGAEGQQHAQPYAAQNQPAHGMQSGFAPASAPPATPYGRPPADSVGAPMAGFAEVPDEDLPF